MQCRNQARRAVDPPFCASFYLNCDKGQDVLLGTLNYFSHVVPDYDTSFAFLSYETDSVCICGLICVFLLKDARKACADATLSQVGLVKHQTSVTSQIMSLYSDGVSDGSPLN